MSSTADGALLEDSMKVELIVVKQGIKKSLKSKEYKMKVWDKQETLRKSCLGWDVEVFLIGDSLGCEASNLTKKLVKIEEELGCWCLDVLKVVHGWLIALTSYKLRGTTD